MKINQVVNESPQLCPECGGPAFSDLVLAEKQDACYHKVRSRYKVWPSAYASGALVQCRKKGADNWGNKSKNEDVEEGQLDEISANPDYLRAAERSRSQAQATQRTFGKSPEEKAAARRTEINRDKGIAGYTKRHKAAHPEMYPKVKAQPAPKLRDPSTEYSDDYSVWAAGRRDTMEQGVAEASPETTLNLLKGLKTWQVVIMNNYYRGKYSDYSGRYYYVLASSPEEARQVVLDNADAILQDLLSMKSVNGKKILPRGSAIAITDKRIGDIKDGTEHGRMTTAGFKRMFGPQGPMMVKLSGGAVADIQGQEQGVAEGSEERRQNRLWQMITDYEQRAKTTKNDIKKAHYLKMASELRSKLKTSDEQGVAEGINDNFEQAHYDEVEKYITAYGTPGEYSHRYDDMGNAHNSYLTYPGRTVTINTQQYGDRFGHNVFTKKDKEVDEGYDKWGWHTSVVNGEFMPTKYGNKNYAYLHDMDNQSANGNPQLVTFNKPAHAKKAAAQFGGKVVKTDLNTYRIVKPAEQGVAEASIPYALSAANAAAEYDRRGQAGGGYRGRIDIPVGSREDYIAAGKALKKAAAAAGQHIEYGLSNGVMSVFSDSMASDELDGFIDDTLENFDQGVAEGQSPEQEIERLKLRQNAEHGGASLKRQAQTQARIRELEKQIKDKKGVAEGDISQLEKDIADAPVKPIANMESATDSDGYSVDQEDAGEYDYEGDQAKDQLQTIVAAARKLDGILDDNENMPEWVQMKITKATDYLDTAADYVAANKAQAEPMAEGEPEKIGGRYDPDEFDAMVGRLKKLAGAGPLKTVYDPNTRRYKNVPTAVQPKDKK